MTESEIIVTKDATGAVKIYKIEEKSTYDPWISVKKLLIQAGMVGGVAALTYVVDTGLPQLAIELPEYAGIVTIVSGVITMLMNYWKHKDGTETTKTEVTPKEI